MILGPPIKMLLLGLAVPRFAFSVRVRYAPSPTGPMHLGGLRTALFNEVFARNQKGTFLVRIEDTDKNREVEGSIDNIFESLAWMGITPDQSIRHGGQYGPYIQSERLPLYKNVEKHLLKSNKAYPCFCAEDHSSTAQDPQPYSGKCRGLSLEQIKTRIKSQEPYAVRIKSDLFEHPSHFYDEVFGTLQFKPLDDFVIVRRNGWPTFHFANVIDDWQMEVTHVMRGEEWLTNTNKHLYLYMVLGAPVPKFVHLPLIKALNGKKLAKRDPQYSLQALKTKQYELEALRSFIFGLGLRHDQSATDSSENESPTRPSSSKAKKEDHLRLLKKGEMIEKFSLAAISRVPVRFDVKQLDSLNREAIAVRWKRAQNEPSDIDYFINKLHEHVPSSVPFPHNFKVRMIGTIADRLHFIKDLGLFKYFFQQPDYLDEGGRKDFKKLFGPEAQLQFLETPGCSKPEFKATHCDALQFEKNMKIIHNLGLITTHVIPPEDFSETVLAKHISEYLFQSPSLKNEEVFHLLRFMITGRRSGPNIVETCCLLGQEEVGSRIARFWQL